MFTTSKKLMIAAATLIPLALLGSTSASAFGLGGFGHMAPMSRASGGSFAHMGGGGFARMGALSRGPMGGAFSGHTMGGLGRTTTGMRTSGHMTAARPVTSSGVAHTSSSVAHTTAQRPVASNQAMTAGSHNTSTA